MLYKYKIQELTEDELGLTVYVLNEIAGFCSKFVFDFENLLLVKLDALDTALKVAESKIKPEHKPMIESIRSKLL